ncbi:MAG: nuclear transport factor 2 family protein [Leadbetterella sp.]|nr:nuclear transport factor 2 family protein [Leadbetterella sp.]
MKNVFFKSINSFHKIVMRISIKNLLANAVIFTVLLTGCTHSTNNNSQDSVKIQRIEDELEIRALADKFSDAANRKDSTLFESLWAEDGVWKIGAPINVEFKGKKTMGSSVAHMLDLWDFFVQLTGPGVINIQGEKATARFYVNEIARKRDDKSGNYNLSVYDDELVKENGEWRFSKRTYYTIYQEAPNYIDLIQSLPDLRKK